MHFGHTLQIGSLETYQERSLGFFSLPFKMLQKRAKAVSLSKAAVTIFSGLFFFLHIPKHAST